MDLFFQVFDFMRERSLGLDLYSFSSLVAAYFRVGDVGAAKRVLVETGKKGLCSNVVMFSQLITGLCWVGSCGDAFDLGKEMAGKVLVADSFTMQCIGPWIVQRSQVERCASGSMKCVNWA